MELITLRQWLYEALRVRAERYWFARRTTCESHMHAHD